MERAEAVERARLDFDTFHAAAEGIKKPTPMLLLGLAKMATRSIASWCKVMSMQPNQFEIQEAEHSQLYVSKRLKELREAIR